MFDLLLERDYKVRGFDNLIGGRESTRAQHRNNPDLTLRAKRTFSATAGSCAVFSVVTACFHFSASATSCRRSSARWKYMSINVAGTVHRLDAPGTRVKKFVYRHPPPATLGCHADPRRIIRSRRSNP